jgi:hypothetical protein
MLMHANRRRRQARDTFKIDWYCISFGSRESFSLLWISISVVQQRDPLIILSFPWMLSRISRLSVHKYGKSTTQSNRIEETISVRREQTDYEPKWDTLENIRPVSREWSFLQWGG